MTPDLERVARAIEDAQFGYSIRLARLVDDVSTYTLTIDGDTGSREFPSHGEALEFVTERRRQAQARAAVAALMDVELHVIKAGAWSAGLQDTTMTPFDAAKSVHQAMLRAVLGDAE